MMVCCSQLLTLVKNRQLGSNASFVVMLVV